MDASKMALSGRQNGKSRAHEYGHQYPDTYSLVEIVFVDGTTTEFMVKAGKGLAGYLRDELRDHQSLTLRNDNDVLVVTREQLRCFTMREITQENK